MRLILLNGPPRCGKDTALGMLAKNETELGLGTVRHIMMAEPIKDACHSFLDDRPKKDADKDKPIDKYGIIQTWREFYILMSEQLAKPMFGKDIFGKIAAAQMINPTHTYVVSDVGFHEEVAPMVKRAGGNSTLLIHLSRPGTNYANDSRGYLSVGKILELTGSTVRYCEIDNRHTLELYEAELFVKVQQWRDSL